MLFTLIAHKPESCDYVRGCLMANYSGDLQVYINLTREELIEKLVKYRSVELGFNESGYDIEILTAIDGFIARFLCDLDIQEGSIDIPDSAFDKKQQMDIEIDSIQREAAEIIQKEKQRQEQLKKENNARKILEEQEREKRAELAQLERLRAKYSEK